MKIIKKKVTEGVQFDSLPLGAVFHSPDLGVNTVLLKISNLDGTNVIDLETMDKLEFYEADIVIPYENATLTLE